MNCVIIRGNGHACDLRFSRYFAVDLGEISLLIKLSYKEVVVLHLIPIRPAVTLRVLDSRAARQNEWLRICTSCMLPEQKAAIIVIIIGITSIRCLERPAHMKLTASYGSFQLDPAVKLRQTAYDENISAMSAHTSDSKPNSCTCVRLPEPILF